MHSGEDKQLANMSHTRHKTQMTNSMVQICTENEQNYTTLQLRGGNCHYGSYDPVRSYNSHCYCMVSMANRMLPVRHLIL